MRPALNTLREGEAVRALYDRLPSMNFSHQVLAARPERLAVLPVRGVEWSDWGEPHRVLASLARIGSPLEWIVPELATSAY